MTSPRSDTPPDPAALAADPARLAALEAYGILDTDAERGFDDLVLLAARVCRAPTAMVSFVTDDRQWFKARTGFDASQTPLSQSVCAHGLSGPNLLVIPDLLADPRTRNGAPVTGEAAMRFYAGARLDTPGGVPLGMLCVLDAAPRPDGLAPDQEEALLALARQVMALLELRRTARERERSEAVLRETETRYRVAARAANDAVWDWDLRTNHVEWNEAVGTLFGYAAHEVEPTGDWWIDHLHPDDRARIDADIHAVIDGPGDQWAADYRFRRADGSYADIFDRGQVIRDADGRAVRMIGAMLDLTERRRAETRLRELNAGLEQQIVERGRARARTWQINPDLLAVLREDGYFEATNPAWKTILGWSEEELAAAPFISFVHPDDVEATNAVWFDMLERGLPALRHENRYRTKDGGWRWLSWVAVPEDSRNYCSARDITEQKEQAEALARTEDLLRQAQKMEAVGQLTGGIAHDFNNLLTGMMGNLELLQARVARGRLEDLDRFILAAQGAGRRAASLTQRLLAFSRRQTLDPRPTDVNRLVAGMEELVRRTVGPSVQIEIVGAAGLWTANIDVGQLENALLNLCINARDAMPDGGRVTIETANKWLDDRAGRERDLPPGQYLSVCVTDTGTGMPPELIARAFEPFFTTKPIGQGTGLGLSMVYGFARQSGGQVRIYSEAGEDTPRGTTVCLYLPRHLGDAEPAEAEEALRPVKQATGQTVLVVDDEPTVRHLIDEVLDEQGYTVIGAADGAAGIKVLQSGARIELLITDVGLPGGMNGRQVADAARSLRPGLRVLFITGYAENAAVGNGHLEPGMELLTKPFTMDALAAKVADMLKARG